MPNPKLRPALREECPALSALCLRSKAHWGYDSAFIEACRNELTLRSPIGVVVAELEEKVAGIARLELTAEISEVDLLFVDPPFIGRGVGRALFSWCAAETRRMGANRMSITSDPQARPFYEAMGAVHVGDVPSDSIEGRNLPLLEYRIR